jgi:two-component system, cell cycle response regulator
MEEKKKIIVVDDNIENLTALKDTLKEKYEVYPIPSAEKMFDLLEHIMPDLILLDVEMPDMNGYDAAKKLKSNEKYKSIPFMFLTIRDDIKSELDGLDLGAVDYIHKPFVGPLLLQRINTNFSLMDYQKLEVISKATVTAMQHIKEGFILVDTENKYISSNSAADLMFPGIKKLAKGEPVFSAEDWPEALIIDEGNQDFSTVRGENTRHYKAGISPVFDKNETRIAMIILISDVTEHVNFVKELEKAAYTDALTGLYNRKHFTELATAEIQRAARLGQLLYMAMLDFDFFKNINDTYGHTAGDLVLKTTSEVIHKSIRSYDLLCRYGGEEFVLLFAVRNEAEANVVTERIRKGIESCVIKYEEHELKITCSIGLAKFLGSDTMESSIKKADEALYAAKKAGRNQVKIYESQ